MKHKSIKFLLLSFIAVLVSGATSNIFAQTPSTPVHFNVKVDSKDEHPERGNVILAWVDGNLDNELGDNYVITQFTKVNGEEKTDIVGKVRRENHKDKKEYTYKIDELKAGDYCYSVQLVDDINNVASVPTERACVKIGSNEPGKIMTFNCKNKFVPLDANGTKSFFVDVQNSTNCEFEVTVLHTDAKIEVADYNKDGAMLKISADQKGKYSAILALVNKCTKSIVDKVELLICYGDCKDVSDNSMHFAEESHFIRLDDTGENTTEFKIINGTNCEYEIAVIESQVKIAVLKKDAQSVLLKFQGQEKGKYKSIIGLKNLCTGEIVSKLSLDICYGACEDNVAPLYFSKETIYTHKILAGKPWKYDIDAFSKNGCPLMFSLSDHNGGSDNTPDGLKIDEKTGELTWENPSVAYHDILEFKVPVTVKSTCDNGLTYTTIVGTFELIVYKGAPEYTSTLHCDFKEETDNVKLLHGKVTVWSAEDKNVPPIPKHRVFTQELNGSSVDFKLPAGKYYLEVDAKGYKNQYYEDAFVLADAKLIEIGDNDNVSIQMTLHALPEPELHVVSGQVTDKNTGEPVQAVISFYPVKWLLGVKNDANDKNTDLILKTKTDDKGNYSIKLPNTNNYYGLAEAIPMNSTTTRYKKQWFEGAETYYEANIINVNEDVSDVNFKLISFEIEEGLISGHVIDNHDNIVQSTIIALSINDQNKSDFKAVTKTDEKGNFVFEHLRYGNYILLSLPEGHDYLPGYFVENDLTTLKWSEATKIGVGDFAPTINYEIMHKIAEKDQAPGIAKIIGRLLKGIKGVVPGGSSDEGDPISGGIVTLTNDMSNVIRYFVSDADGNFELNDLLPGTYTLTIDKVGYEEYSEVITIDYGNTINVETEVVLNKVTATSVDYDSFDKAQLTVSPMPVSNISTITFDGTFGTSSIKLIDMTGNVVYQSNINTVNGINQFNLDSKNILAGAYILVINNNAKAISGGITIIK